MNLSLEGAVCARGGVGGRERRRVGVREICRRGCRDKLERDCSHTLAFQNLRDAPQLTTNHVLQHRLD